MPAKTNIETDHIAIGKDVKAPKGLSVKVNQTAEPIAPINKRKARNAITLATNNKNLKLRD